MSPIHVAHLHLCHSTYLARLKAAIPERVCDIVPKVGMPIAKYFPDTTKAGGKEIRYCGIINSVDVDAEGKKLYGITYEDGDAEDLHLRECQYACQLHSLTMNKFDFESELDEEE